VALSAIGLVMPNIAQAVTVGTVTTRMEIDGDKANAAGFDWNDIQDGTLPGGYVISPTVTSAGVFAQTYQIDGPSITQSCGVQDADSVVDGSKLDENPWPVQAGLPNSKNDICSGGAAVEAVNVNGAVHYMLYQYYTRTPSATGDQSVVMSLNGPLPGRCDDLLLDYNFGPSSGLVTTLYRWTPQVADACANPLGAGSWGNASVVSSGLVQTASGANTELTPATANPSTFGEFAIDLTAAGVLPDNRCVTFTTGSTLTYTGNSTNASLKDILNFSNPIVLNNCGAISVAKVTEPTGFGAGQNFTYKLNQTDAQAVHDSTIAVTGGGADTDASNQSITSMIQTAQTHVWSNILAQPDYQLQETAVPANWQVKQITCTFWDPFFVSAGVVAPQLRTVSTTTAALGAVGIPSPQLKPAAQPNTNCTITNSTSGIRLVKAGSGDANQTFNFSMTGQTVPALKLGTSADFAFAPGTSVSINETLPNTTPAWQLTTVTCKLPNGDPVGTVTGTQVALQTVAGQVVTCTYTNDQKARIVVNKAGTGSAAQTFPFEQSWDGNATAPADFSLAIGQSTNSGDIAAGTYTVSELLPATSPAWLLNNISCTDDAAGANHSTTSVANPTATITLAAGDTVSCTFTNAQQGRLVLVKNTVGPDGTFSFSGPIGSVATTSNSGTVGLDVAPGTYPVAETVPAGWALTSSSCDQGRTLPNVVISAGQTVTCTFNNTKLGKIIVTKQALPDGSPQQFTFDGSWNGAGNDLALTDGQSGDSGFITPGTYSVAETNIPAGWDLTSATCSDGSPVTAIAVSADETVTCTFTNTQRGNIVIVKNSGVAAGTFTFNQTWSSGTGATTPFNITTVAPGNTGQQQFDNVAPGSYTVSETDPGTSFDLKSLQCVDGANSTNASSPATPKLQTSGTVNVDPGETVVCTFSNSKKGTIVIVKDAQPNTAAAFDFTASAPLSNFTINGSGSQSFGNITATEVNGTTYPVAEGTTPGWTLDSINCSNTATITDLGTRQATISVGAGETVTCTFTNIASPATLSLTKSVSGVDPSYPWSFDFTLSPPGAPSGTKSFAGTGNSTSAAQTWTGLVPGQSYTLNEQAALGWNSSISCTLTAADGSTSSSTALPFTFIAQPAEAIACAASNAAAPANATVTKLVTGLAPSADWGPFTIKMTPAASPASDVVSKADPVAQFSGLIPGTSYTLDEMLVPGWTAGTFSCSVTHAGSNTSTPIGAPPLSVQPGDHFECGITNTAQPATLQVIKTAIGAGGDVTFPVTGLGSSINISLPAQGVQSSTPVDLVPGTEYGVSESDPGDTWIKGVMACTYVAADGTTGSVAPSAFTPTPGEAVTCRITNTKRGTITIDKVVVPAADTTEFGFTFDGQPFGLTGAAAPFTSGPVDPATYVVDEPAVAGWKLTSLECVGQVDSSVDIVGSVVTIGLMPGENVTCTYTNNRRGPVTVLKTLTDGPTLVNGNVYTVGYDLAVTSESTIDELYNLSDVISFGTGTTILSSALTTVDGPAPNVGGWDGVTDTQIQDQALINPTTVDPDGHTYHVVVTFAVNGSITSGARDCVLDEGETGTGTLNTASVSSALGQNTSSDCGVIPKPPTITVIKNVVNNDGGNAVVGDFPLFVGGSSVTSGVALTVNANQSYGITETQRDGYALASATCVDAAGAAVPTPVLAHEGDAITCTLVNDDLPVDLQLTKSDGGVEPLAGETFTYTLTVGNIGSRDVDLGEPVVVTDMLPTGVSWVLPMPANCTAAGQVVTCTVNPADLQIGESVVISLQARIDDIAAATTFTNKAFVTTTDDPACTTQGCVPPCVAPIRAEVVSGTNPSNNVDCEDTPAGVLTDVAIDKSTTTPSPFVGTLVSYTLTVSNLGPNAARDVTVTDPIPVPLQLQSVVSADFTCTSANNSISCSRPVLQVGEIGTITVTALVPDTAVGGITLQNTATVHTTTNETNLDNNTDTATVVPVVVAQEAPVVPVIPPTAELPRTGLDVGELLRLAALLAAGGAGAIIISRRRKRADLTK